MPCESKKYVGRDVALEFVISCGDTMPAENEWLPIGSLRTKELSIEWDTADATADDSLDQTRENLATYKSLSISGDGVAKRADEASSNQTLLQKHVISPTETGGQPIAMFRLTFPDITIVATMLVSTFSRSAPYDDIVTFSFEASNTTSAVGVVVTDTPVV